MERSAKGHHHRGAPTQRLALGERPVDVHLQVAQVRAGTSRADHALGIDHVGLHRHGIGVLGQVLRPKDGRKAKRDEKGGTQRNTAYVHCGPPAFAIIRAATSGPAFWF